MTECSKDINYFKIGTFVLVGLGLIVFALLIFGSDRLFQRIVYVETYFEESIQGITEGTKVKYRGLEIGHVKKLAFTSEIYKQVNKSEDNAYSRSIYVQIAITSKLFTDLSAQKLKEFLTKEVEHGLRIKIVPQGLTGTSYLEFDYVKDQKPQLPISWQPYYFYIPSIPSTLTKLAENAQYIINELKDIDFKKIFNNVDNLTVSLRRLTGKTESLLTKVDEPTVRLMQNFENVTDNLKMFSERVKLKPSDIVFSSYPQPLDPSKL
jgi:paraquat-inducible protein B